MMYVVETSELYQFSAWSGGKTWLDEIQRHPKAYEVMQDYIEEAVDCSWECGDPASKTTINDILWFETPNILEENGLYDPQTGLYYDDEGFGEEEEED